MKTIIQKNKNTIFFIFPALRSQDYEKIKSINVGLGQKRHRTRVENRTSVIPRNVPGWEVANSVALRRVGYFCASLGRYGLPNRRDHGAGHEPRQHNDDQSGLLSGR